MRWRSRHAKVLLGVYSIFLAVALFSPASTEQSGAVYRVCEGLWAVGLSDTLITFSRMEVLANVVIVTPVSLIGSFVWRTLSWRDWTAYAFVGAMIVELVQGFLLPDRHASFGDVVANTTGACLGAGLVRLYRRQPQRLRPRRTANGPGTTSQKHETGNRSGCDDS